MFLFLLLCVVLSVILLILLFLFYFFSVVVVVTSSRGGGLAELPIDEMLAPGVIPSMSQSDVVSESLRRDMVLGGDK